jgi:replicative DNA helicase
MDKINHIQAIEKAILSSILFDNSLFDDEIVSILDENDFYFVEHRRIFKAMKDLFTEGLPIDETFIIKRTETALESKVIEILSTNPITNLKVYIEEICEFSKLRKLESLGSNIKILTEKEKTSDEIIYSLKANIEAIESNTSIIEDFTCDEIINTEFKKVPVYETGIKCIDDELGGVANGQLVYVIGLEETGKTHITYKIMENLSYARKTGIISLEFGKEKLKERLLSMVKNGHKLNPSNIKASFNCHDINKLERTIRKWVQDDTRFIVIDSINLIENNRIKDRFERVLDIGTRLFKLVQQLNITLFVISTSTKQDNKEKNPSIYGGQLLNNYCDQKWMIMRNFDTEERILWINKNKQNFKYPKISLEFDKRGFINKKINHVEIAYEK